MCDLAWTISADLDTGLLGRLLYPMDIHKYLTQRELYVTTADLRYNREIKIPLNPYKDVIALQDAIKDRH